MIDAQQYHAEPLRVLHVTEAMAAGVLQSVRIIAAEQARAGMNVSVLYIRREESPTTVELRELFGAMVELVEVHGASKNAALYSMARKVRNRARADSSLAIHIHSSVAGAVVRLQAVVSRFHKRTIYTPHGFSFLRQDVSPLSQWVFKTAERILSRFCAGLILVSESEGESALQIGKGRTLIVIENAVAMDTLPMRLDCTRFDGKPRIMVAGRISAQKAPERFVELSRAIGARADFIWIGDGDDGARQRYFAESDVNVTGWKSHFEVLELLESCTVFVLLSRWEGLPLALIEAQCMGIPAVISDIPGSRDIVKDGVSGYVVRTLQEAVVRIGGLLDDPLAAEKLSQAAVAQRARFAPGRLGAEFEAAYRQMLAPKRKSDEGNN